MAPGCVCHQNHADRARVVHPRRRRDRRCFAARPRPSAETGPHLSAVRRCRRRGDEGRSDAANAAEGRRHAAHSRQRSELAVSLSLAWGRVPNPGSHSWSWRPEQARHARRCWVVRTSTSACRAIPPRRSSASATSAGTTTSWRSPCSPPSAPRIPTGRWARVRVRSPNPSPSPSPSLSPDQVGACVVSPAKKIVGIGYARIRARAGARAPNPYPDPDPNPSPDPDPNPNSTPSPSPNPNPSSSPTLTLTRYNGFPWGCDDDALPWAKVG